MYILKYLTVVLFIGGTADVNQAWSKTEKGRDRQRETGGGREGARGTHTHTQMYSVCTASPGTTHLPLLQIDFP